MDSTMRLNFDKLLFTKTLSSSGYTQEQSEALAEAVDKAITQSQSGLATLDDLQLVKAELKTEINEVRTELRAEIQSMKVELLKYIGAATIASTTILIAVMSVFKFL
ncbi:hypothetical protein [Gallibacterium salpingitidis]|uniref:hypothetical protein n=1 Tax=Gallibacterium salpingitidis TaxID=505341 RepID=UPI0012E94660|nr:hypothetical protein [Gallibacterium salpingitidis]